MLLTANEKNRQQQKWILFYLNDRYFCSSKEKVFHSILYNDCFFLIIKHRGHLIINS
jgi:hypothetical protein